MKDTIEPIWAASVDDVWWRLYDDMRSDWTREVCDWMRAEGLDPEVVYGLEVYLVDAPYARVNAYVTDEQGRVLLNDERSDARRCTFTRVLSSYPPEWPQLGDERE